MCHVAHQDGGLHTLSRPTGHAVQLLVLLLLLLLLILCLVL